nr:MAG TPA: hypothetical protein [Bacteriophage sp.]
MRLSYLSWYEDNYDLQLVALIQHSYHFQPHLVSNVFSHLYLLQLQIIVQLDR